MNKLLIVIIFSILASMQSLAMNNGDDIENPSLLYLSYKEIMGAGNLKALPSSDCILSADDCSEVETFVELLKTKDPQTTVPCDIFYEDYSKYRDIAAKAIRLGFKHQSFIEIALSFNDCKFLEYLLKHGANAQDLNIRFHNPLIHYAQTPEAVQLLLNHGAPITAVASTQYTLLHRACHSSQSFELLDFYVNEFKKRNLLEKYINDQKNDDRVAPIHYLILSTDDDESAVQTCLPVVQEKLKLLLDNGADCLLKTSQGRTPQSYLDLILANKDINTQQNTRPYLAKIARQLAEATKILLSAKKERSSCIICTNNIYESQDRTTLPCGHVFHAECLQTEIKPRYTCPRCATSFADEPSEILPHWFFNENLSQN